MRDAEVFGDVTNSHALKQRLQNLQIYRLQMSRQQRKRIVGVDAGHNAFVE